MPASKSSTEISTAVTPTPVAAPAPAPAVKAAARKAAPAVKKPAGKAATKPAGKLAPQLAARATAKPAGKAAAAKPPAVKAAKEKKIKMVRDSISLPKTEYTVLDDMKLRAGKLGVAVKKTELIRAGIKALAALADSAFLGAVRAVPNLKTGRPAKSA